MNTPLPSLNLFDDGEDIFEGVFVDGVSRVFTELKKTSPFFCQEKLTRDQDQEAGSGLSDFATVLDHTDLVCLYQQSVYEYLQSQPSCLRRFPKVHKRVG